MVEVAQPEGAKGSVYSPEGACARNSDRKFSMSWSEKPASRRRSNPCKGAICGCTCAPRVSAPADPDQHRETEATDRRAKKQRTPPSVLPAFGPVPVVAADASAATSSSSIGSPTEQCNHTGAC